MTIPRFDIERSPAGTLWAELVGKTVRLHRTRPTPRGDEDTVLVELSHDTLRNLLVWADGERAVTASLTGPLAREVRENAKHLGLTPEMFVGHAVRVFLEVGRS